MAQVPTEESVDNAYEAQIKQLKMEVSALRHVVDNCNSRVALSQFSENELKLKMAKMVVAIRDKTESASIFSSIVHQFPNTRTEISVLLYKDMIEKGEASENKPVRTPLITQPNQPSPATTPKKKVKNPTNNLSSTSNKSRASISASDLPGTRLSDGFDEKEKLDLATALSQACRDRDDLKEKLTKTVIKLSKAHEEIDDLKNQFTYLNREVEVLRGKKVEPPPQPNPSLLNRITSLARFDSSTSLNNAQQQPQSNPFDYNNPHDASTNANSWACMLLMALWSVVSALDESETYRKIEQEKRTVEDSAVTGQGIAKHLQNFTQTVRGKFHHSESQRNLARSSLSKNNSTRSMKLDKMKKGYSTINEEGKEMELTNTKNADDDDKHSGNSDSDDDATLDEFDDNGVRRVKIKPLMRRVSTNDLDKINATGKTLNGNQPFNVVSPNQVGLKWGGAGMSLMTENRNNGIDGSFDYETSQPPPKDKQTIANTTIKREPVKFSS